MRIEANWYNQKGTKTTDNRDHAGLGINTSGIMSIVVDGSTAGADNGEYAGVIVREMVDWFTGLREALDLDALTKQLRGIRLDLRARFPRGSASFIVVHTSAYHELEPQPEVRSLEHGEWLALLLER